MNELAERVAEAGRSIGLDVEIKAIANPRKEREQHYYHPAHTGLIELGLEPHLMTDGGPGRDARDGAALRRPHRSIAYPAARAVECGSAGGMRRWLITGGCGFIGCNLVRHLLAEGGVRIRVLDNLEAGGPERLRQIAPVVEVAPEACGVHGWQRSDRAGGARHSRRRRGAREHARLPGGRASGGEHRRGAVHPGSAARLHGQRDRHAELPRGRAP